MTTRLEIVVLPRRPESGDTPVLRMTLPDFESLLAGRGESGQAVGQLYHTHEGVKLVVATPDQTQVSRWHAQIHSEGQAIRVKNVSHICWLEVELASGEPASLRIGQSLVQNDQVVVVFPSVTVTAQLVEEVQESPLGPSDSGRHSVGTVAVSPTASPAAPEDPSGAGHPAATAVGPSTTPLAKVRQLLEQLRRARGPEDFALSVLEATVPQLGHFGGRVLFYRLGGWRQVARTERLDGSWSQHLLDQLRQQKRLFYVHDPHSPEAERLPGSDAWSSVQNVKILVALAYGADGEVACALSVETPAEHATPQSKRVGATPAQQEQLRLLAEVIAFGAEWLERLAATANVFRRFVPPALAVQLIDQIETQRAAFRLPQGRTGVLGILFADVRGFSDLCQRLDRDVTDRWLADLMQVLCEEVERTGGMVTNESGDQILALWGAAGDSPPEQAARAACQAARNCLLRLPELDAVWREQLGAPTRLSIGVHVGEVTIEYAELSGMVRFRPVGTNVNLASRVEGATRKVDVPLLITGETAAHLPADWPRRRLRTFELAGIPRLVDLYQLCPDGTPPEPLRSYEEALAGVESAGRDGAVRAVRLLAGILAENPTDGPAQWLFQQALDQLRQPDAATASAARIKEK